MANHDFVNIGISEYSKNVEEALNGNMFVFVNDTFNTANAIVTECINTRTLAVNPGQQPDIDSKDTFTIIQFLSKTTAAMIKVVTRAEYHEKQTRTIGLKLNGSAELQTKVIEMEENINNQANAEEVINKMAELVKGTGTRGEGGGARPVS